MQDILRYKQNTVCKPMYYTPDLWIHVQRVAWFTQEICRQLGLSKEITQKALRRAMFHDDSEIIAGDIATPVKQNWTDREKQEYEERCKNAIPILVSNYWPILGEDYEAVLREMEDSQTEWIYDENSIIHAILEYADKLDALMEVIHELYSGSNSFLNNLWDTFGFDMNWFEYVINRVQRRRAKIEELLQKEIPQEWVFCILELVKLDIDSIVVSWKTHTKDSILVDSWITIYEIWKKLHINSWDSWLISQLYTQRISL